MEGKRLIRSIKLTNLLSFGPDGMEIELQPLNVLIGANGSGKSNFIEAFRLLQAAPRDLTQPFIQGSGVEAWLWKGVGQAATAEIEVLVDYEDAEIWLDYLLAFTASYQRVQLVDESLEEDAEHPDESMLEVLYRYNKGQPVITALQPTAGLDHSEHRSGRYHIKESRKLPRDTVKPGQSILSQRNDPEFFPEISYLADRFGSMRLYTDANLGRFTPARKPQDAALDQTYLFEDASNLALVLNDLQNQPQVMQTIIEKLKLFYERAENIITRVSGGTVQIYLQETGLQHTVPAPRLSDGTLRFLCLLVILLHPTPPPLICIEEPELGMHPDIIGIIADLLIEASQRTQLIVTTHSDLLVSKLTDIPEAVVVCERGPTGTTMSRLDANSLDVWLQEYSLGEVWLKGGIGGTRW